MATITFAALSATGTALAATPRQQAMIDSTVRFLQEHQQKSGAFAETGQQQTSQGITAWAALALAAAGINPRDQARCGTDVYTYLVDHFQEGLEEEIAWPRTATTAFERELLVVDASGTDPHDFAGHDLVAEILRRQRPDGGFPYVEEGTAGESNDTIFAILALSPVHEASVEAAVEAAAEWVVGAEDEDGGWYYSGRGATSEVDMTGAALEALVAAGPPSGEPGRASYERAISGGLAYLREAQLPDGGFPALPTKERESNVASTAWAVQGIWATGGNPEEWVEDGHEPLDYMEAMQQPDGHIRWRANSDMNGIWMTAYVTPAFAGQALPIPTAARYNPGATHRESSACEGAGVGGESGGRTEEGVLTGGGGHGAPAFSRPKAQSKGKAPGGARILRGEGLRARDQGTHRRGTNLHQARGTEKAEPARASEADQEAAAVRGAAGAAPNGGGGGRGGDAGKGAGESGAPGPAQEPRRTAARRSGEEVSGVVIGSPSGDGSGKLAFGAPGLRGAEAGGDNGLGGAIAIAVAALLGAGFGVGRESRRGRPA